MFHCGKSAMCCASNVTVSELLPCSHTTCCSTMGLYGKKRGVVGDHYFYQLWDKKRMVWETLFIQFSGQCVGLSGQVPFALKLLDVGVTLKSLI